MGQSSSRSRSRCLESEPEKPIPPRLSSELPHWMKWWSSRIRQKGKPAWMESTLNMDDPEVPRMKHTAWLKEVSEAFDETWKTHVSADERSDEEQRGLELADMLVAKLHDKGPDKEVKVVLIEGVGRILYVALKSLRTLLLKENKKTADDVLNGRVRIVVYDMFVYVSEYHRRAMPNVHVVERTMIPALDRRPLGSETPTIQENDVVYFNFWALVVKPTLATVSSKVWEAEGYDSRAQWKSNQLSAIQQRDTLLGHISQLVSDGKSVLVTAYVRGRQTWAGLGLQGYTTVYLSGRKVRCSVTAVGDSDEADTMRVDPSTELLLSPRWCYALRPDLDQPLPPNDERALEEALRKHTSPCVVILRGEKQILHGNVNQCSIAPLACVHSRPIYIIRLRPRKEPDPGLSSQGVTPG